MKIGLQLLEPVSDDERARIRGHYRTPLPGGLLMDIVISRIAGETPSGERVPMTPILDAHGDPVTVEQMRRIRRRTKRANKKK